MNRQLAITCALLLSATTARAQDDEAGLRPVTLTGPDPVVAPGPQPSLRPQLVDNHDGAWRVASGISMGLGVVAEVTSWALYVAAQNYRLTPRTTLTLDNLDHWQRLRQGAFWTGVGASTFLVAGEYVLLPESREVPTLALIGGAAGLGLAAVGVGFWAGGSACQPTPVAPGVVFRQACMSGTSDDVFGQLLLLASAPLIALPLTYWIRSAVGSDDSLSVNVGPGTVRVQGVF